MDPHADDHSDPLHEIVIVSVFEVLFLKDVGM